MDGSASRKTLPPSPPSPPSGPPRGTNFSRRKLTQPAPPVAALDEDVDLVDEHLRPRGRRARSGGLLGDADVLVVALALEANVAVGGGEQRVVRAEPDVGPRLEPGATLPHDDAARGHELPAEALDAEPLGIGIAAVARAADALLVCHVAMPRSW